MKLALQVGCRAIAAVGMHGVGLATDLSGRAGVAMVGPPSHEWNGPPLPVLVPTGQRGMDLRHRVPAPSCMAIPMSSVSFFIQACCITDRHRERVAQCLHAW